MYWIHRNELAINTDFDSDFVSDENLPYPSEVCAANHVGKLEKLWLFGDRLADTRLRNTVMEAILVLMETFDWENPVLTFPPHITVLIWSNTTKGRTLRTLVLNHYVETCEPRDLEPNWDEFHPDFIKGLAMTSLGCGTYESNDTGMCNAHIYYEEYD